MNSFNHYAYGSIGEWLVRTTAGLEIDEEHPGYEHFYIRPQSGGGLTWAEITYKSVRGNIAIHWSLEGDVVTLSADIPETSSADFVLTQAVKILDNNNLPFQGTQAHAEAGHYVIRYQI